MLIISEALSALAVFMIIWTNDLYMTYFLIFLNGYLLSVRITVTYIYMMELVLEPQKKTFNFVNMLFDAITVILIPTVYIFIKYGEFLLYVYVFHAGIMLFIFISMPESPHFLYSKRKFDLLRHSLNQIARVNNANEIDARFDTEITASTLNNTDGSIKELFRNKTHFCNLIIMIINWCMCSFSYYVIGFFVKYFKGNMYTNAIMMGLADLSATFIIKIAQSFVSTKPAFLISFMLICFSTILYFFVQNSELLVPMCILLMRSGAAFAFSLAYFTNSEIFPPEFQSAVFGF